MMYSAFFARPMIADIVELRMAEQRAQLVGDGTTALILELTLNTMMDRRRKMQAVRRQAGRRKRTSGSA